MNKAVTGVVLLIIDGQNDFMGNRDGTPYTRPMQGMPFPNGKHTAALPVKGATDAMDRLAAYIDSDANGKGIDDVVKTLDTHEEGAGDDPYKNPDIGHPAYWRGKNGAKPAARTVITLADVQSGKWQPANPLLLNYVLEYLGKVGFQVIWPRHCVDGTWGHQVYAPLAAALKRWEERTGKKVLYVRKGMNTNTEQYGAFEAAVPDPKDPRTQFNWSMYDHLLNNPRPKRVGGIATDFCVKTTMEQAVAKMSCGDARNFGLLADAMADVNLDGAGTAAKDFFADMQHKGVTVETCYQTAA